MRPYRLIWIMLTILLASCSTGASPTPEPVPGTPGPLTKTADYWDLGLRIKYPDNWAVPQFLSGQMTLAGSMAALHGTSAEPIVAIRVADPVRDFHLSKDATLQQIAAVMSSGQGVTISGTGTTNVAGLDAAFINLTETNAQMYGQAVAFRMPDGRVGSIIGVAPFDQWANFAPTFDQMRNSVVLLKPADFTVPTMSNQPVSFAPGGLTFELPQGWIDGDAGSGARLYHDGASIAYLDDSGFVNGPQLVLRAWSFTPTAALRDVLTKTIQVNAGDTVLDITVGGTPGVQITSSDPTTGQIVLFIGVTSQDKTVLNVFRWTAPGILAQALQPTLNGILQSVRFGAVKVTRVPPTTPASH